MLLFTVAACLLTIFLQVESAEAVLDCDDDPPSGYTLDTAGKRYYRVLQDVLWDEAKEKCELDGAQLAVAYSVQDYEEMRNIGGSKLKQLRSCHWPLRWSLDFHVL